MHICGLESQYLDNGVCSRQRQSPSFPPKDGASIPIVMRLDPGVSSIVFPSKKPHALAIPILHTRNCNISWQRGRPDLHSEQRILRHLAWACQGSGVRICLWPWFCAWRCLWAAHYNIHNRDPPLAPPQPSPPVYQHNSASRDINRCSETQEQSPQLPPIK